MAYESVVEPTIRKNIYNTVFTLINTYKLSGWTVLAAFPENLPTFPCIIINPSKMTINKPGFQIGSRINEVEIMIELFAKSSDRLEKIDLMMDKLHDILVTYESTLFQYNLILFGEDAIIDSDTDRVTINDQDLNTSAISVRLQVR